MVGSKIVKSGDQLVQGTQEMERKQSLKEMRGYMRLEKVGTDSFPQPLLPLHGSHVYLQSRDYSMRLHRREMWRRLRTKYVFLR